MAALRPAAPAPQNAADDSDGGSLRRLLPRAAWDCLAAYVASPEFALVLPMVSKTFCRVLDGAPAWARAWAALSALRSTHLAFAKATPWCYREDRTCTKAERKARYEELKRADEEMRRALDNDDHMATWEAVREAQRAKFKRQRDANNWFGMPSREPRVGTGGPWKFKGPGVSDEATRSNALPQRSSRQLFQADDSDEESDSGSESESESESESDASGASGASDASDASDSDDSDDSDASGSGANTESDPAESDVAESGGPQPAEAAVDAPVHPRVLLAGSQEAQYWRRLRGALEAWAARLPAAKGAAVRDFATRASPGVFITAEAQREVLTKRGRKQYLGSKLVSIATLTVNQVLVRIVVVPECWCHGRHDSEQSQSLTCGFRRPGEQWVLPINYESQSQNFGRRNGEVARGDLLLDMAKALEVAALDVPDLVHLLYLLGGTHPVVGHIMYRPYIFSDWIEYIDAARRGELKHEQRLGSPDPESIAWEHWDVKTRHKRPDLSAFGSLLVFSEFQHGLHEHTFSGQYPQRESPDDRDQPVRTRKAPTFEVRLPRSARPGATIMAIAPNGKEVSAVVPLGSGPGSTIMVRY